MYGSTCFKCGGAGNYLTKRGRVAQNVLTAWSSVRADELRVGEKYRETGVTVGGEIYSYWSEIKQIERNGDDLIITTTSKFGPLIRHTSPDTVMRKARKADEVKELRALALEFQSKVNRSGRVALDITL